MTFGPIRADVYLDGELQASTAADFYGHQVTVLEGLKVGWGRETAVDQPSPASLGLSFAQEAGHADFLTSLSVGRTLEVTATGRIETGAVANIMTQGDFEALAVGDTPAAILSNVSSLQVTAEQKHGGAHSARARATTAASASVVIPPAPFSADPKAWDAIPRASKGETWSAAAWVWSQWPVTIQAVAFTDPTGNAGTYVPTGPTAVSLGGAGWLRLDLPALVIGQSGRWIGVKLTFDSLGTPWTGMSGPWTAQVGSWLDQNRGYLDDLAVNAPAGGTDRSVLVFQGRITDMSAKYVSGLAGGTTQVDVTAKDFTADLANNRIGDVPWVVEALGDRVDRILALAGTGVTALVDDSIAGVQVTYRDVDSQPAAGLVTELATSVAGVAWSAVHDPGGAYYWIEDPRNRTALYYLQAPPEVVTRTNLVQNPGLEGGSLAGVAGISSAVVSIDATQSHSGTKSVKVVTPGVVGMEGVQVSAAPPMTSGPLYSCGVWIKAPAGAALTLIFRFNGSGSNQGTLAIIASGAWQFVKFNGLSSAPFNPITGAQIMVRTTTIQAVTFWVDDAIVEMAPAVGSAFNGSSPPAGPYHYRWTGPADASTSQEVQGGQVEIRPNPNAPESIKLTAHNVLEEPVRWDQDVADVATRVDVTWLEQGVDDKGKPTTTERHQVAINGPLEDDLGQRGYSVSTQLISAADASQVANSLLAAQHPYQWRLSGITWAIHYEDALSREETVAALDLLDGTVRIGHSLTVSELPSWVPISGAIVVFIEGGTYTFESGDWWLELVASSSGQGASVTWATVDPAWTWTQFQNLSWMDLIGVAGPPLS